jgi:hypothetical protein
VLDCISSDDLKGVISTISFLNFTERIDTLKLVKFACKSYEKRKDKISRYFINMIKNSDIICINREDTLFYCIRSGYVELLIDCIKNLSMKDEEIELYISMEKRKLFSDTKSIDFLINKNGMFMCCILIKMICDKSKKIRSFIKKYHSEILKLKNEKWNEIIKCIIKSNDRFIHLLFHKQFGTRFSNDDRIKQILKVETRKYSQIAVLLSMKNQNLFEQKIIKNVYLAM